MVARKDGRLVVWTAASTASRKVALKAAQKVNWKVEMLGDRMV